MLQVITCEGAEGLKEAVLPGMVRQEQVVMFSSSCTCILPAGGGRKRGREGGREEDKEEGA